MDVYQILLGLAGVVVVFAIAFIMASREDK